MTDTNTVEEIYKGSSALHSQMATYSELSHTQLYQKYVDVLKSSSHAQLALHVGARSQDLTAQEAPLEGLWNYFPRNDDLMGLDWNKKDLEKSLCAFEDKFKDKDLFLAGARLNRANGNCRLEGLATSSVKIIMPLSLIQQSKVLFSKDL